MLSFRIGPTRAIRALPLHSFAVKATCSRYPIVLGSRQCLPSSTATRPIHTSLAQWQNAASAGRAHAEDADASDHGAEGVKADQISTFADLGSRGLVDQRLIGTITDDMKIHTMTDVQCLTIPTSLKGVDV